MERERERETEREREGAWEKWVEKQIQGDVVVWSSRAAETGVSRKRGLKQDAYNKQKTRRCSCVGKARQREGERHFSSAARPR